MFNNAGGKLLYLGGDVGETLRHTAEWYRRYFDKDSNMRELCYDQIDRYGAALRDEPSTDPVVIPQAQIVSQASPLHTV